jgi:hypothetical protein
MRKMSLLMATAAMLLAPMGTSLAAAEPTPPPLPPVGQLPEWTDTMFDKPYVDVDEWRDKPVRHRHVHGGFKGTGTRFSVYFPVREDYQGRFFQPVAAYAGNENAAEQLDASTPMGRSFNSPVTQENTAIGFAIASGAYLLVTNNGATQALGQSQDPEVNTVIGYRANAAAAQYSRKQAAEMYGAHRPYGYIYGGSGGSLKTICAFENTLGVWDGAVPYVYGTPMSMPNVFSVAAHAKRILKDKFPAIIDALDPGGSGDPYAGLNEEEREALREVTRMGMPPRAWFASPRLGYGPMAGLINNIRKWDPQYFEDYWKVPGYLGASPPASLAAARIQQATKISRVIMSDEARKMGLPVPPLAWGEGGKANIPAAIELDPLPSGDLMGASLIMKSGAAEGKIFSIASNAGNIVSLGFEQELFASVKGIRAGDEVQLDNSIYLAAQTYHRHQVPTADYYVWDQFRDKKGDPIYPQRPRILGPDYNRGNSGCTEHSGWLRGQGKMIMVETLVDEYSYPWQADWYRNRVREKLGDRADQVFRLWMIDNAMHSTPPPGKDYARIISYTNVLQQALRDVSAWVERGVPPPQTSAYRIADGQVEVPATAAERRGVQPVVTLTVNGAARVEVRAGQRVQFSGSIEVPPGTGKVVSAQWDFEGAGTYPVMGKVRLTDPKGERAAVAASYAFARPGTYFPALRGASQRTPERTPYARIENLARVRVIVR